MVTDSANQLLKFLEKRGEAISPLLITTHDYPDPDALASAYGLKHLAHHAFGIRSRIVYQGVIGRMENRTMAKILKLPVYKVKPEDLTKYKHTALVDTQPAFENNWFPANQKATIIVDQHVSEVKANAECTIIDPDCGATAVIIAQALLLKEIEIPSRLATALAYGIISDTMNLYRANKPEIIDIYLKVLPFCDLKALAQIQNPVRSRRFFATLGKGIENAVARSGLITAHLGNVENPDLVSQVADFLLTYRSMKKSFCTGRYNGRLYVSLRLEKTAVNAGRALRDIFENRGEAGGHDDIAGGSFSVGENADPEAWIAAEETMVKRLLRRFRIRSTREPYYPFRQAAAISKT
jgi:nanoRNase/pAp phosphatase (c-di-AMP/oligoRNAs hydrolase)